MFNIFISSSIIKNPDIHYSNFHSCMGKFIAIYILPPFFPELCKTSELSEIGWHVVPYLWASQR